MLTKALSCPQSEAVILVTTHLKVVLTQFSITNKSLQSSALFSNQNPFGNSESLAYTGGDDPNNKNYVKLTDALNEADTERRKAREAAERRERAAEIRREERQAKIDHMMSMPDSQPAGTGTFLSQDVNVNLSLTLDVQLF